MINIFYLYGIIWGVELVLYLMKWSDYCSQIKIELWLFICILITCSFALGYAYRKKLKYKDIQFNQHKKPYTTIALGILYILSFIYSGYIPFFKILAGQSYHDVGEFGIPHLTLFISSFSIFYIAYLSANYASFKNKKVLIEITVIVGYFVLLFQRQNILICCLIFGNTLMAKNREGLSKRFKKHKKRNIFLLTLSVLIVLYLMGIIGNMRYGSMWKWYDSSMILALGKANSNMPSYIPTPYFWSYLYAVQPLATLNINISTVTDPFNVPALFCNFIPQFITNKIGINEVDVVLLQRSLTAATGYAVPGKCMGIIGMIIYLFSYLFICVAVINSCMKRKPNMLVPICNILLYFLIFTVFTNTFHYSITFLLLIYSIIACSRIRINGKSKRAKLVEQNHE